MGTELGLTSGPLGEHNQSLGDIQGNGLSVVHGDEKQREINPRGDPGGGVEIAIPRIKAIVANRGIRT
jgi:hypothetical protein